MKFFIFILNILVISNHAYSGLLDLKQFNSGALIKAEEYNENFGKIYTEVSIREFPINEFTQKSAGDLISKDSIEEDFNNVFNALSKPVISIESSEIKATELNSLFSSIESVFSDPEIVVRSCTVASATSCQKTWNTATNQYDWNFNCNPNYNKVENSCSKKAPISFSIDGKAGLSSKMTLSPGQSVRFTCSGTVTMGKYGGFNCTNNSYGYTDYRVAGHCHSGSPIFHPHNGSAYVEGYYCALTGTTYTNNTGGVLYLHFLSNDSDRSNNSGSFSMTATFLDQF